MSELYIPRPHKRCSRSGFCIGLDEVMSPSLHDTASRVADEVGYELLSHRFERVLPGHAYIAPGGLHLSVELQRPRHELR